MADRPIIFSAPMIRALLAGTKTQTRRLATSPLAKCKPGDRLYVRESAAVRYEGWHHVDGHSHMVEYAAGGSSGIVRREAPKVFPSKSHNADGSLRWCPSIHMPRWASRLTLIVEGVKVEPLTATSEADAIAEGITRLGAEYSAGMRPTSFDDGPNFYTVDVDGGGLSAPTAVEVYRLLWGSLHDKPDQRWEDSPSVVALTFRVERGNIDRIEQPSSPAQVVMGRVG